MAEKTKLIGLVRTSRVYLNKELEGKIKLQILDLNGNLVRGLGETNFNGPDLAAVLLMDVINSYGEVPRDWGGTAGQHRNEAVDILKDIAWAGIPRIAHVGNDLKLPFNAWNHVNGRYLQNKPDVLFRTFPDKEDNQNIIAIARFLMGEDKQ